MSGQYSSEEIKRANIEYHARMAASYDSEQPQYRQENIRRVEGITRELAERYGNHSLLDIGCGTGFILNIAKKYFDRVVGIDITQAMLDKVDLSSGNVELRLADSSAVPFGDDSFDVCTAYGFLHHLPELQSTFAEVFRCLKPGGAFYADQDPNHYCWKEVDEPGRGDHSEILKREIDSMRNAPLELKRKYGLDEDTVRLAEFQKLIRGGMREESIQESLLTTGFHEVHFEYQWFLGQGYALHSVSEEAAKHIEDHLRRLLPLSRSLFKYVSFMARK